MFRFAGKIVFIDIQRDDNVAFIRFEDPDSAEKLLDCGRQFVLGGHQLAIVGSDSKDEEDTELDKKDEHENNNDSQAEEESESAEEDSDCEEEVYVRNLPRSVTEDDLQQAFKKFGKIRNVTIFMDGGRKGHSSWAFLEFKTAASARALVSASLKTQFEIKGTPLKIGMNGSEGIIGCNPPKKPVKSPRNHLLYNEV